MYVRWLGAFHKSASSSISESVDFEMNRSSVAACEHLQKKKSYVWARVGLIISKEGIIRRFNHDVWSLPNEDDPESLIKTRDHAYSSHHEAWCKPGFVTGIVTKIGWWTLRSKTRHAIEVAAKKYNLPVYFLSSKGVLKEVVL